MFAARANQENAIYEQQTAAAAKPLNQGVKGLAPKTPGNKAPKTPFKVPLNDENVTFGPGKTGGKGKQDGLFGEAKANKVDRSAFVTPGGTRHNLFASVWIMELMNEQDLAVEHHWGTRPRMRRRPLFKLLLRQQRRSLRRSPPAHACVELRSRSMKRRPHWRIRI